MMRPFEDTHLLARIEYAVQSIAAKIHPRRPSRAHSTPIRRYSHFPVHGLSYPPTESRAHSTSVHRYSCSSTRDLPYLPTEVWLLILREATAMFPDPLDISPGLSFLETPCVAEDYFATMCVKRDLSLVSKTWNKHMQEFLYEFVWIRHACQVKALALTLLTQFIDGKPSSGRWIRRLHMDGLAVECCAADDFSTILDHAPCLVPYLDRHAVRCVRDQEFSDVRCSPIYLVSALAVPNSKLRRLSLTNCSDVPFPYHMSPMLKRTARNLEYLELSSAGIPLSSRAPTRTSPIVSLPVLQSLKLSLDNAAFAVLASWEMPSLRNVSVVLSDFGYAGQGFANFFEAHGSKIEQLELGHSSSLIVEHNLSLNPRPIQQIPLADWCPNLKEFICSADAKWNRRNPDWIVPHIPLPAHRHLRFIGVRDIDKRIVDYASPFPADPEDDAPFFPLLEQISSLLFNDAFPSLRYIRDLSRASHTMRFGRRPQGRILKFWANVLARCEQRQVWLEDYRGVNITVRDLERAGLVIT
ncbi:hypothetical protein EDD17DRAFT_869238 [Pisolithus thermaeus]|nr:hypothetical protein EV401DRAFT_406766 [Pisolithus croceorrhizus]KAI6159928.1 hypothetical protein EDD17DRAFT_869238 [Pisolithus thermaeus]